MDKPLGLFFDTLLSRTFFPFSNNTKNPPLSSTPSSRFNKNLAMDEHPDGDSQKRVVNEMNFFADDHKQTSTSLLDVKKELAFLHDRDDEQEIIKLDVNVSIFLSNITKKETLTSRKMFLFV